MHKCQLPFFLLAGGLLPVGILAQPAPGQVPGGFPPMVDIAKTRYQAALDIHDSVLAKAASSQWKGRTTNPRKATGISLDSRNDALNALIVRGKGASYALRRSSITLHGKGTNDFAGIGAGVLVHSGARLLLDRVHITTNGPVSSAAVAAERGILTIRNSRLVANGGALPQDYKPHIGPGMMEPPTPLEISGSARTLLAMSHSHTYLYHSLIEADGWGALSTDATGGDLYLEANDCTIRMRHKGYGAYADAGAHVVINRGTITSGAFAGIIAGKARLDLNGTRTATGASGVMVHSVMGLDPFETALLNLRNTTMNAKGAIFTVKSANVTIAVAGGSLTSARGVLLEVLKNTDPNATATKGQAVPGVRLNLLGVRLAGDVIDSDPERATDLTLARSRLSGVLQDVTLAADKASQWLATGNSRITLTRATSPSIIDAPKGVHIIAQAQNPAVPRGSRPLKSGGQLTIVD